MSTRLFSVKSTRLLLPLLLSAHASVAQYQDTARTTPDEHLLQHVVVTGQYRPVRPEDAVQRVRIIDSRKIAAMGAQNLRDVLINETNLSVTQDNVLGSSVSIQGISGQNVKMLIDGVPVIGRQNGNIDIAQLSVYNVERIELIEGPMSVNYGTDALAGTINIITRSVVRKTTEAGASLYTETIGKYNVNAHVGLHSGRHSFLMSGSRNFFDGWDPKQGFQFLNFSPRPADSSRALQWNAKEEYNAGLQYIYKRARTSFRIKSDYFGDLITNRGLPRGYYGYSAFDDYYRTKRFSQSVFAETKLGRQYALNILASYNRYSRVKNTFEKDLTNMSEVLTSGADQDTSAYRIYDSRGSLACPGEGGRIAYEAGYDITLETGWGKRIADYQRSINDYAIYASAAYRVADSLFIRGGVRMAYNTSFRTTPVPSVNLKYTVIRNGTLRASYAKGFRAPGVKELFFEFKDSNHDIVGNTGLTPERSEHFGASFSYVLYHGAVRYSAELSVFYNSITDMISLAQPDSSVARYTYVNIDKFRTKGLQLNGTITYKGLDVHLGGSCIGRYNQLSAQSAALKAFTYAPELRCNVSYTHKRSATTFSLFGKYTGPLPSYGLNAKGSLILITQQAYTMADFSVSRKLVQGKVSLIAGCKNLFNITNVSRNGATDVAGSVHAGGTSSTPLAPGRSLFLGAGYEFHTKK